MSKYLDLLSDMKFNISFIAIVCYPVSSPYIYTDIRRYFSRPVSKRKWLNRVPLQLIRLEVTQLTPTVYNIFLFILQFFSSILSEISCCMENYSLAWFLIHHFSIFFWQWTTVEHYANTKQWRHASWNDTWRRETN